MMASRMTSLSHLVVVRGGLPLPAAAPGELVVSDDELRGWVLNGRALRHIGRFRDACLLTERLSTSGRPMLAWALRLMATGRCSIVDTEGRSRDVTLALLLRWSWQVVREAAGRRALLSRTEREIGETERTIRARPTPAWNASARPVYLRTDLSFGVRAGGSVGHTAGVLNELAEVGGAPILLTTAPVPTVRPAVELHQVAVPERFWNFRELPTFVLNDVFFEETLRAVHRRPVSFVYQRYSLNNYAGLRLAHRLGVPLVVEYNGSEVWMSRHWGRPLLYDDLASRIELLNVNGADLVVVVSRAMRDELLARGVDADRVLVNPNAVDPDRYSPAVDGSAIRRRYQLDGRTVLGFISTFQVWHGAVVLARAFAALMAEHPQYHDSVRLLMIGSGVEAEAARRVIVDAGFGDAVHFTGLVEQEAGPAHLAACDILVSPHVPNADGTPFFGSPTKLFEYMAMGKGIVASNLDQIGEVLRHGETAWLVPPGDAAALSVGLDRLLQDDVLRRALGAAARLDVLARHTWRAHVRRTLDALDARVNASAA
jgi:glycosyltransferase involved in cell wall biosynthesis